MLKNLILPVLIFLGLGLVIGIILSVISVVMAVKENKKITQIRKVLPGINCGVCSYSGCDSYAKALVEENAKPNLCASGGAKTYSDIAEILGLDDIGEIVRYTALVQCGGSSQVTSRKLLYKGMETCLASSDFYGGTWICDYGCLGFGDCALVCEYDAITTENGLAIIDASLCVGCGECIDSCPKHIINLVPSKSKGVVRCSSTEKGAVVRQICSVGCIGCGLCKKACKYDAIVIENYLAKIDYDKCIGCGECVKVCPTSCINVFTCDMVSAENQ